MYHVIEFRKDLLLDIEISPRHRLSRMAVKKGFRLCAQIRPYVVETTEGPVEVADLYLDDGTVTRLVSFASFAVVD